MKPSTFTAHQKRVLSLALCIFALSAGGWAWIYSTAPAAQKPTLLLLAIGLFVLGISGFFALVILFRKQSSLATRTNPERHGSFFDMGRSPEAAEFFAAQLEKLMSLPLTTPADVQRWNQECERVKQQVKEKYPKFEFYHEVWHFFADPEIRSRDPGYRKYQHDIMCEYVKSLRTRS